jgi:cephalosporin hydroxylase
MNYQMEKSLDLPLRQVLQVMQNRLITESTYFGIKTLKSPIDFWIYQEIVFETKPDFIIEIGNFCGGSALSLAHLCDSLQHGKVIGLDISHSNMSEVVRNHPRITLLEGDACELLEEVKDIIGEGKNTLVIEDSSHTFENTLNVLNTYSQFVKTGGYFIVEDGICHHGLDVGPNPGPYEAVEEFIKKNVDFEIDRNRESFLITWNPIGYLKRVR